jgi:outer membrane receptor protein involved in Fe transport
MKMRLHIALQRAAVVVPLGAMAFGLLLSIPAFADESTLAEIVVTAQKREQNLQDVPISVTVLSGVALQDYVVVSNVDLSLHVPNIFFKDNLTGQMLTIRGIGSGVDNAGFEQAVAQFVDGVYYGRATLDQNQVFDVDRVEVVRGPQPIFAGQSATAGAISTYDRKPGDTFEGYANGSYGKYKETSLEAAVGGPLTDSVGIRLAGRYYELPETDYSNWNGDPVGNKRDSAERVTVTWKASDTLDFTFKGEHQDVFNQGEGGGPSQCELRPQYSRAGSALFPGLPALCAMDVEALGLNLNNRSEAFQGGYFDVRSVLNGLNLASGATLANPIWGYNSNPATGVIGMQAIPYGLNHVFQLTEPQDRNYGFNVYSGTFNLKLNDLTLTSITSYMNYDEHYVINPTYSPYALFADLRDEWFSQRSEEIRLSSPADRTFSWMVGAYYQHHNLKTSDDIYLPWAFFTPTLPPGAEAVSFGGQLTEVANWYDGFFTGTWKPVNALRLNFGGRYQDISKSGILPASYAYLPANGTAYTQQQPYPGNPTAVGSETDRDFLPEAGIQYDVADGVMTYAKWSKALKAGGFVMEPVFAGGVPNPFTYKPEKSKGFEIGVKSTLFNHTVQLDADWYYTKYTDLQVSAYNHFVNTFVTTNAGEAHARGIEFDARWLVTHGFMIAVNGNVLSRAVYDVFNGASCNSLEGKVEPVTCLTGVSRAGVDLPFSQHRTVNVNPDYVFAVSSGYEMKLDLFASFNSGYTVEDEQDPRDYQHAYERIDANASIRPIGGHWEVGLYGRNLTDNRILLQDYTNFAGVSLDKTIPDAWGPNLSLGIMYGVQFKAHF